MNLPICIDFIIHNRPKTGRFIVGIDGMSRSGKSTLAEKIKYSLEEQSIPAILLHIDDHIVKREQRYETGKPEWQEYYKFQWNVDKLVHSLFQP
ncbi:hypothetical protein [Paenisporosarcina cavernae]|uniref:hypothetical protein n=1 Tax=Paenisporosarcina cavernae TaxID=2320858 RepID=UPI001EE58CDB|nr:hypothetical protein [Paenisporosarcina cavernae]